MTENKTLAIEVSVEGLQDLPARTTYPVTGGIPFAPGVLNSPRKLTVRNRDGRELPFQADVLARWEDRSIKALLLMVMCSRNDHPLRLSMGGAQARKADSMGLKRRKAGYTIDTGDARIDLGAKGLERIQKGKAQLLVQPWQLPLQSLSFAWFENGPARVTLENDGPLSKTFRLQGAYISESKQPWLKYDIRLTFRVGFPGVHILHTLVDDDPASMVRLRNFGISIPQTGFKGTRYCFGGEGQSQHTGPLSARGEHLYQSGRPGMCEMQGWETAYEGAGRGQHAAGWGSLCNSSRALGIGIRHFWQQFPKELRLGPKSLEAWLQTDRMGEFFWNEVPGLAKTHELLLLWASPEKQAAVFNAFQEKPLLVCEPSYYCRTGVFPHLAPPGPESKEFDELWQLYFDRMSFNGQGIKHFGDKAGAGASGPVNPMPWGNHHYEEPRSFMNQFLRTGDRRFFDEGEAGVRHHADIDTQHSPGPNRYAEGRHQKPNPGPGFVWMHYSHDHQGLGHVSHFHLGGMPQYYLLQGDPRIRDVIRETADYVANLIEKPPPAFAVEYTGSPKDKKIQEDPESALEGDWAMARDRGWMLHLLIEAYEAIGGPRYLKCAARLIRDLEAMWKKPQPHIIQGKRVGEFRPPHGAWASVHTLDGALTSGLDGWGSAILLYGVCQFHHINNRLKLFPAKRLEPMMYQHARAIADFLWLPRAQGFRYGEGNPPRRGRFWPASIFIFPLMYVARACDDSSLAAITHRAYHGKMGIRLLFPEEEGGRPYDETNIPFWLTPHYLALRAEMKGKS